MLSSNGFILAFRCTSFISKCCKLHVVNCKTNHLKDIFKTCVHGRNNKFSKEKQGHTDYTQGGVVVSLLPLSSRQLLLKRKKDGLPGLSWTGGTSGFLYNWPQLTIINPLKNWDDDEEQASQMDSRPQLSKEDDETSLHTQLLIRRKGSDLKRLVNCPHTDTPPADSEDGTHIGKIRTHYHVKCDG